MFQDDDWRDWQDQISDLRYPTSLPVEERPYEDYPILDEDMDYSYDYERCDRFVDIQDGNWRY